MPPPASNEGNEPLVFPDISIPNPATIASNSLSSLVKTWISEAERFPEWGYHHKMVITMGVVAIGLVAFFIRRSQQYQKELEAMVKEAKSQ
ncbi:uncharacterized protein LY89DRAFT_684540 [Mollisia scopiformis]|uniref:Uncharacterized protein n=1 Tax=Mollisia scopiformis TaxID=149040 RepID=A0A194XBH4_MOLSC|nr:uncharacterized protein LY89DRAFT_684540 [Mollisia scopiformis]KUJ17515.1 hypothetical protein LY89DRAFT_684540 [Mollisia scopiformis]